MSSIEGRLQSIENSVLKLTAQVAELKTGTVPMTELIKLNKDMTELKTYAKLAGGLLVVVVTGALSVIGYLIFK
jgi:hypothetical protein